MLGVLYLQAMSLLEIRFRAVHERDIHIDILSGEALLSDNVYNIFSIMLA